MALISLGASLLLVSCEDAKNQTLEREDFMPFTRREKEME